MVGQESVWFTATWEQMGRGLLAEDGHVLSFFEVVRPPTAMANQLWLFQGLLVRGSLATCAWSVITSMAASWIAFCAVADGRHAIS